MTVSYHKYTSISYTAHPKKTRKLQSR